MSVAKQKAGRPVKRSGEGENVDRGTSYRSRGHPGMVEWLVGSRHGNVDLEEGFQA